MQKTTAEPMEPAEHFCLNSTFLPLNRRAIGLIVSAERDNIQVENCYPGLIIKRKSCTRGKGIDAPGSRYPYTALRTEHARSVTHLLNWPCLSISTQVLPLEAD